jgi:hypothetical protein
MGQNGKKHCVREEKKLSRLLSDYGRTWHSAKPVAVMDLSVLLRNKLPTFPIGKFSFWDRRR